MSYCFISYKSENRNEADKIRQILHNEKIKTWMAPYDIPSGSSYPAEIGNALKNCDTLILLLNDIAQASVYVEKEVERAISYKKTIIPLQIEETQLNPSFDYMLSNYQFVIPNKISKQDEEIQKMLASLKPKDKPHKEGNRIQSSKYIVTNEQKKKAFEANNYYDLAYENIDNFEIATRFFLNSMNLYEELLVQNRYEYRVGFANHSFEIGCYFLFIAKKHSSRHEYKKLAKKYLNLAKSVQLELVAKDVNKYCDNLINTYIYLIEFYKYTGGKEKIIELVSKLTELCNDSAKKFPIEQTANLALAAFFNNPHSPESIKIYLQQATMLIENNQIEGFNKAKALKKIGVVYAKIQDYKNAIYSFEESANVYKVLDTNNPEKYDVELSIVYYRLANCYKALKQYENAAINFENYVRIIELQSQTIQKKYKNDMISSFEYLYPYFEKSKDYSMAINCAKKYMLLTEDLNGQIQFELARLYAKSNDFKFAKSSYESALKTKLQNLDSGAGPYWHAKAYEDAANFFLYYLNDLLSTADYYDLALEKYIQTITQEIHWYKTYKKEFDTILLNAKRFYENDGKRLKPSSTYNQAIGIYLNNNK